MCAYARNWRFTAACALATVLLHGAPGAATAQVCLEYQTYWHDIGGADTGWGTCLTVAGDLAYVGGNGLNVVDLADAASWPVIGTSSVGAMIKGIAVKDGYAYISTAPGSLRIFDVSNPASPHQVGQVACPENALDVVVVGQYAFVACHEAGVLVVDVADPVQPAIVASVDTPDLACRLLVADGILYCADFAAGLQVIDIGDPLAPVIVGAAYAPGAAYDLVRYGDYIVLAAYWFGLVVFDVSTPTVPVQVAVLDPPGDLLSQAMGIDILGHRAFVATGLEGVLAVDLADPQAPKLEGVLRNPHDARDVVARAGRVYAMAPDFKVIDTAQGFAPPVVGSLVLATWRGVAVSGAYAYVGTWAHAHGSLKVVDLSDPAAPVVVGAPADTLGRPGPVAVAGEHVYVGDLWGALRIVDVSEPAAPVQVGSIGVPGSAVDVVVAGDLAVVACDDAGVAMIDVQDPSAPSLLATLPIGGAATGVAVTGQHLFVAAEDGRLLVADIASPSAPAIVATMPLGGQPRGLTVAGGVAYVADGTGWLRAIDVAAPGSPVDLGQTWVAGSPERVVVAGAFAYLAGSTGIDVVDVSDPTAAAYLGCFTARSVYGLAADGSHVYTTATLPLAQVSGLHVLWPQCALPVAVQDAPRASPIARLLENVPNPFNPATSIRYELGQPAVVQLTVHDLAGRVVRRLVDGERLAAGHHQVRWDGRDDQDRASAAGVYVCRLQAAGHASTRRLVLVK